LKQNQLIDPDNWKQNYNLKMLKANGQKLFTILARTEKFNVFDF